MAKITISEGASAGVGGKKLKYGESKAGWYVAGGVALFAVLLGGTFFLMRPRRRR